MASSQPQQEDDFKVEKTSTRACALKLARNVVKYVDSYSKIKDPLKEESIPKFLQEEIICGKLLGKGGFNQVYAVDRIELLPQSQHDNVIGEGDSSSSHETNDNNNLQDSSHHRAISDLLHGFPYAHKISTPIQQQNRQQLCRYANDSSSQVVVEEDENDDEDASSSSLSSSCDCSSSSSSHMAATAAAARRTKYNNNKQQQHSYAIKFLTRQAMEHSDSYCNGAADLMMETKILSNLKSHPNIITLHGIAAAGIQGIAQGTEGSYFLILDRLEETLDRRLHAWNTSKKCKQTSVVPSLLERITIGLDIASALHHLHDHGIIFRDLKPDNIGFDSHGSLKIFDFGLAKELDPRQQSSHDDTLFHMSNIEGSRIYMAPEVVLGKPYGLKSDVYSFGVLVWQLLSLEEQPYKGMSLKRHTQLIVKGSTRLPLDTTHWSQRICNIMKWSWQEEQDIRPSMSEITRLLKSELRSKAKQQHASKRISSSSSSSSQQQQQTLLVSRSCHTRRGSTSSSSLLSQSSRDRTKRSLSNSYHHRGSSYTSNNSRNHHNPQLFSKIPSNIVDFIQSDTPLTRNNKPPPIHHDSSKSTTLPKIATVCSTSHQSTTNKKSFDLSSRTLDTSSTTSSLEEDGSFRSLASIQVAHSETKLSETSCTREGQPEPSNKTTHHPIIDHIMQGAINVTRDIFHH